MTASKSTTDRIENQSDPPVRHPLVSIPEAAEMLCVCRTSIYELIRKEELIAVHIGRSVRPAARTEGGAMELTTSAPAAAPGRHPRHRHRRPPATPGTRPPSHPSRHPPTTRHPVGEVQN